MSILPLCFVLMPFGKKKDAAGIEIDFDQIYQQGIHPAIVEAELEPLRADAERTGGVIHKAMFERLLLSEFAVADLTTANANVFYELGVRHAARRNTTLPIFADGHLPFDLNYARTLPYSLGPENSFGAIEADKLRKSLAQQLKSLVELNRVDAASDSPLFQIVQGYRAPELAHMVTDTFRDRVHYANHAKQALEKARESKDLKAIEEVDRSLGELDETESAIAIDIMLSYRDMQAWDKARDIILRMPEALRQSKMVQEQYGLLQNRLGERETAIGVLQDVINKRGRNPESCGILGRVYKDQWQDAVKAGKSFRAKGILRKAIDCYIDGFEADWRDFYPGINAVTLLKCLNDPEDTRFSELLPVVQYSVNQRFKSGQANAQAPLTYWDYATQLELAALRADCDDCFRWTESALAMKTGTMKTASTAANLSLIRQAHEATNQACEWMGELIAAFEDGD